MASLDYEEVEALSEYCRRQALLQADFITARQYDELARRYRRLAENIKRLNNGLLRAA